jgi:hypothetical protein
MEGIEEENVVPSVAMQNPMEATAVSTTPLDMYFDRLESVIERVGAKGSIIIEGIESSDEEDEDETKEVSPTAKEAKKKEATAEQVANLRHIVITQRREEALEKMGKAVLGAQYGDSFMMFTTSFSYEILENIPKQIEKIKRKKDPSEKFDLLFALTYNLDQYDTWLNDYEDSAAVKSLITKLGNTWKKLLAMSDEELKIDPEFTRPGVMKFLENFAETVEDAPETFHFKYT